jgi:cyclopropane fatty-acyl-phospholipid synthase-like methyltransferase
VLDITCGKGDSALVLAEAFGVRVTGIDASLKNALEARAAARKHGWDNQPKLWWTTRHGLGSRALPTF